MGYLGAGLLSDESLFREVDEEVRRDKMEELWKRYGTLVIAVALGIIVGVAGYKGWQYYSTKLAESTGAAYIKAMEVAEKETPQAAEKAFKAIEDGSHSGFAMLARLQSAGALAGQGNSEGAVAAYNAIAADTSVDATMRDMARVRAAYLLVDSASSDDLRSRLAGLDVDGSSWRASAREIIALAYYREAKYVDADKLVSQILADAETPQGVRQRSQVLASLLQPLLGSKTEN